MHDWLSLCLHYISSEALPKRPMDRLGTFKDAFVAAAHSSVLSGLLMYLLLCKTAQESASLFGKIIFHRLKQLKYVTTNQVGKLTVFDGP